MESIETYYDTDEQKRWNEYTMTNSKNLQFTAKYPNGQIKVHYSRFSIGSLYENVRWFYENGVIKQRGYYLNSKRDGIFRSYYDNKMLKEISYYSNGNQEGVCITYDVDGKILKTVIYFRGVVMDDILNSRSIYHKMIETYDDTDNQKYTVSKYKEVTLKHPNGVIEQIKYYLNSEINGIFRSYYDNEMLKEISYYLNGRQEGVCITYDVYGKILETNIYFRGVIVDDIFNGRSIYHKMIEL